MASTPDTPKHGVIEAVGTTIATVAVLNTLLQIISYLSGENVRMIVWTWIKDMVDNYIVPAEAPAPNPVNNQMVNPVVNYVFQEPCHITFNLGNGQAPAEFNQIQGPHLPQIAHRVAPDADRFSWLSEDESEDER